MIYIDPPYNTGNDFIYNDSFTANKGEYEEGSSQRDGDGNRLSDLDQFKQNTESNGRYHSDWLSMMYPRLKLARNLLKDDGVIFISLDDNEITNLRKICDEVFGEENFKSDISWQKRYTRSNNTVDFTTVIGTKYSPRIIPHAMYVQFAPCHKPQTAKVKTNKGSVEVKLSGTLVRDYQGKFEKTYLSKFLRSIYEKWVIPSRVEEYEDKLVGDCDEFLTQVKSYLDLEGKK